MSDKDTATAHETWDERWQSEAGRQGFIDPDPAVKAFANDVHAKGAITALDLGCGVGRHALYLAASGFQVSATDASEAGIEFAKASAAKAGFAIDFKSAPMTKLPFEDGTFDYVLSWNVIYHGNAEIVGQAVSEIRRVLKPGGHYQGTMLSKRHEHFGQGQEVSPDTWSHDVGDPEKAHPHFYLSAAGLVQMFNGFELLSLYDVEQDEPGDWHWYLTADRL